MLTRIVDYHEAIFFAAIKGRRKKGRNGIYFYLFYTTFVFIERKKRFRKKYKNLSLKL